jgi:hypothetical protein
MEKVLGGSIYVFGKRVAGVVDDPLIRPFMKAVAETHTGAMS